MRKILIALWVVALLLIPAGVAQADADQEVTLTVTPSYISITNAPNTWLINGITGNGLIAPNGTYHSNPLGDIIPPSATVIDGECYFTITNTSTIATNIYIHFDDFTSGEAMTNSNTGSATPAQFGAYSYHSGMTYTNKVIAKTTGSGPLIISLPLLTNLKWGLEISTQTYAWSNANPMTSTVTITATAAP